MNIYSINCPNRPANVLLPYAEKRKGTKGYQEAPTLTELLARDKARLEARAKIPEVKKVTDEMADTLLAAPGNPGLAAAYKKAWKGERLTEGEALTLLTQGELMPLGYLATRAKERFHPGNKATFLIDRNINYTNVCRIRCDFCAFYRNAGDSDAYTLPKEEIFKKIEETIDLDGTGVLMQGGVNPHLKIEYYEDLFRSIKERYKIHLHALSVIEVEGLARVSRLTVPEALQRLKAAGLDSIPGAGAEILSDEIRLEQSPVKRHAHRWIDVMKEAHKADLPTTATMMFGALEGPQHIIEHIARIRDAQDETQGFYAFIAWTFQGKNTELAKKNPDMRQTTAVEYLKTLAVTRIFLDNIPNIQGSWVTMGPKVGQTSLHFGANDVGSIMIEENVVSAAGTSFQLNKKAMIEMVRYAGFTPMQRDTYYNIIAEYPDEL